MPKYVIHVGPPKTATTYLQHNFNDHRSALREHGTWYPERWVPAGKTYHRALFEQLRDGDASLPAAFAELAACGQPRVLLSCEHMTALEDDALARLGELIGVHPYEIVYYVRNMAGHVHSLWQSRVRHGSAKTLPQHFEEVSQGHFADPGSNPRWLGGIFGEENLRLVSYNEVVNRGVDLFTHFAETFLDWPDAKPARPERANPSFAPAEIELIRALNALAADHGGPSGETMRRKFRKVSHGRDLAKLAAPMTAAALRSLSIDETAEPFIGNNREAERRFGCRMVDPRPQGYLFSPSVCEFSYYDTSWLQVPRNAVALRRLYDQLLQE